MSVFAGPEISQSGLVFAFDMGNRLKSWKGAPVTNLAFGNFFSGNANFTVNQNVTDSMPDGSTGIARELNAQTVVDANRTVSIGSYSLTAGSTYTLSFYVKNISCTGFGGNLYSPTLLGSIASIIYPTITTGIWIRVETTFTVPTGSGSPVTVSPQVFRDGGFGLFRMCWLQLEERSFATPYVENTRSSTQAILDLVNTYTLTPTGLVYNSDGSFSFNGSSYVDLNSSNIITGTNPFTVESWYTTTGTTADEIFGNYGSGSTANTLWISGRYGVYISGTVYFPGSPLGAGTYHLAASRDTSGNVVLYKNGIQVNSGVLSASIPVTYNFRIGADVNGASEPFTGKIHRVNVFNRVLTASEIQQNFNALRGRFGI